MLGDGLAIDPTLGELHAPCDGEVIGLHACSHAVTIRAANGAEILLHVGLETVHCGGIGFEALTAIGRKVARRRPAADVRSRHPGAQRRQPGFADRGHQRPRLRRRAAGRRGREVALGEPVLTLRPIGARAEPCRRVAAARRCVAGCGWACRTACMPGPPRWSPRTPAGFAAEIALEIAGRRANARSPVAVMALGVRFGDEIEFVASGADAAAALEALAVRVAQGERASAGRRGRGQR